MVHLRGSVPAANSLRLPRQREDSLDARGRFLYLQLRLQPGKAYAINADVSASDRGLNRLTISNLQGGREEARMRRSGMQARAGGGGRAGRVHMGEHGKPWLLLELGH